MSERPAQRAQTVQALQRRITELERDLAEATADRERRERAERDFITNAAHELQTPLAAITSAIEVLQAGAKDDGIDRDRFLAHIEAACRRLDRLTRALLVLARAQTRDELPRREVIPLEPLFRSIAASFPRDAQVVVDCPHDIAVIANRPLLEQAIANLGHNAVKHSRGPVVFFGSTAEGRVTIEVRDSGPGIAVAERELVFRRFYRRDDSTRDGFGLGLAIVAESVKALEGELELDTSAKGTRVVIRLPSARIVAT
jgi:two-component system sensor histidine kinase TctE